jgi:hypothetical protein
LNVTGVNNPTYTISNFTYDSSTNTAIWTLSGALPTDKINIDVHASGANAVTSTSGGQALDGDWTNTVSAYPSGDGAAGGDFSFGIHVLPADANQDGIINAQDLALISSNWLKTGVSGDVNDDGIVNAQDLALISSRWLATLPAGTPAIGGGGDALVNSPLIATVVAPAAVATSSTVTTTTSGISVAGTAVPASFIGPLQPAFFTGGTPTKATLIDSVHSSLAPTSSLTSSKTSTPSTSDADDLFSSHVDEALLSIVAIGPRRT